MSGGAGETIANPGMTAVTGDPDQSAEPAESAEPSDVATWLWALYDVLSASHRDLPLPPFPRP